jgi:hypothetical protein
MILNLGRCALGGSRQVRQCRFAATSVQGGAEWGATAFPGGKTITAENAANCTAHGFPVPD